jgi:hypothetical protein
MFTGIQVVYHIVVIVILDKKIMVVPKHKWLNPSTIPYIKDIHLNLVV